MLRLVSLTIKPSPPLGLAFIASSLVRAGHQVTVIDAIAEKPDQYIPFEGDIVSNGLSAEEIINAIPEGTEVLGLSIMFTNNWLNDRKLIDAIGERLPQIKIIAGGEHITGLPDVCMSQTKHLDVCVLGEGEDTAVELIRAFENRLSLHNVEGIVFRDIDGNIIRTTRRKRIRDIEEIAWPAWDLFPLEVYRENGMSWGIVSNALNFPILATRGCPYECTFCSSPNMWGTRYYMRSTDDLLAEIKYLKEKYGATQFDFYDLTAILNKRWIIELSKKLIEQKIDISWQIPAGTRSEVIDAEVSKHLYLSGCKNITYAPESGSQHILDVIKKRVSMPKMFQSIRNSCKNKLNVKLNIIIGFPEETHKDIWLSILFLIKASYYGVNDIFAAIFMPYTGCAQFDTLVKEGKIDPFSDAYYYEIIDADSLFMGRFYNNNVSQRWFRFYRFLYFSVFYGSNWLFRPQRFFRLVRNMITQDFQSRGERGLYNLISRPFKKSKKSSGQTHTI